MTFTSHRPTRPGSLLVVALACMIAPARPVEAQWSGPYEQASLRAPHNRAFAERYPTASEMMNAIDYQRASLYESLWRDPGMGAAGRDSTEFVRLAETLNRSPRVEVDLRVVAPEFAKLAPETQATLAWGWTFRRQLLDALSDSSASPADRDGHVAELVSNYRARTDFALAVRPKSPDLLDAQLQSLAFRTKYARLNGLGWATQWLEAGLYESLVTQAPGATRQRQIDALVTRFRQMIQRPTETTPVVLPLALAVAPTFAQRYPNAAAIIDNLSMFESSVGDLLVSREIPRSAKRREMDAVRAQFQSDTAFVMPLDIWTERVASLGVNNMGGPTVGFGTAFPLATVARGASMARQASASEHQHGAMENMPGMPGMQHDNMQPGQPTQQQLMAIYTRMMSDPVIRERAATDPALQQMLRNAKLSTDSGMAGMPGMPDMPGMRHDTTHTMAMSPATAASMMAGTPEERRRAIEFVVRLLSDPAVEARIHSYPELHVLWSDPEVQRRLTELKKTVPRSPGGSPPPKTTR